MLTVNPAKRITATEALKHPWICVSTGTQKPSYSFFLIYEIHSYTYLRRLYFLIMFRAEEKCISYIHSVIDFFRLEL